jgi:hypothetical protein
MGLSLSAEKLLEMLFKQRKDRKEQIALYLELVAEDAKTLAEIWQNAIQETKRRFKANTVIFAAETQEDIDQTDYMLHCARIYSANWAPFYRLEATYYDATNVLGGRVKSEFQNLFLHHLAKLILERNKAKEALTEVNRLTTASLFVDDQNRGQSINDFVELVEIIQREAATLEILARRFRSGI